MLYICRNNWEKYSPELKEKLTTMVKEYKNYDSINYLTLVKTAIEEIMNKKEDNKYHDTWDVEEIVEINHGDYQGTLLYVIPLRTYQPSSYEYIFTHIEYGSCECCDVLLAALDPVYSLRCFDESKISQETINEAVDNLMRICKDIICNVKRPYFAKFTAKKDDWSEVEDNWGETE